ncbi:MAG TPA: hypothetical protein VIV61_06860 [Candidatus Ozemobacteraceae bacterium]
MQTPMSAEELQRLLPRTVKVDLDTPLESAWTALTMVSAVACVFILQVGFVGGKRTPPDPEFLRFLPWALGAVALFIALKKLTDNYYLVDRQRKGIFYHFDCLGYRSNTPYLAFSDVDSVIVNGSVHHSKHSRWFEYQIQLIDRHGKSHTFSDSLKEAELGTLNTRAETISKIIECRFVPGKSECIHTVETEPGGSVSVSTSHTPLHDPGIELSNTQLSGTTVALVLILVLGFFGFVFWASLR